MAAIINRFPGAIQHPSQYFGYPLVGSGRRIKPTILGVIHTTETLGVPFPSANKSWTFSVERDGTAHQFLDPMTQAPWTNGDLQNPDTSNPYVKAMVGSQYNANEFCLVTIENVNRIFAGERLTDAQLATNRAIMQWASGLSGLPIERARVIGHYQVNGNSRVNCPTIPGDRARVFDAIIKGGVAVIIGDDMPNLFKYEPGVARLDQGAAIRKAPSLAGAAWFTVGTGGASVGTFIGWVKGDEYAGSTDWGCYIVASGVSSPTFAFTHRVNVLSVTPYNEVYTKEVETVKEIPTGITQSDFDAAVAKAASDGASAERTAWSARLNWLLKRAGN